MTSQSKSPNTISYEANSTCTGPRDCLIAFQILKQLYIGAMVTIFICSLGNRPQGSKGVYTTIIVFFAFIMGVMVFYGGFGIYQITSSSGNFTKFSDMLNNKQFRDMVLATMSTFGLYLVSSILHLDPW